MTNPDAFYLDEEPLRNEILKGYFGDRSAPLEPEPLMAHLRQVLSGPPGSQCDPGSYHFELKPEITIPVYFRGLEKERKGLAALIATPILKGARDRNLRKDGELPPNPAVFISSLAGSIAVKAKISEALAGALLAGFLIAVARIGPTHAEKLYGLALPHGTGEEHS